MVPIRVLIVDDSAFMRRVIADILKQESGIEVAGYARNGREALVKIADLEPDVVTLDLQMPVMDGLDLLRELMPRNPVPVVILSALAEKGTAATITALECGAVDFVLKPSGPRSPDLHRVAPELVEKVRRASEIDPRRLIQGKGKKEVDKPLHPPPAAGQWVIVIGASTGGPRSLHTIFSLFPPLAVSVLVVQHMPPGFTASLAERLDRAGGLGVTEASQGMVLRPGVALVAPGDRHLKIREQKGELVVNLTGEKPCNRHRPSVDVTMVSVAELVGKQVIGVVLTGMGSDGARGITRIRNNGGHTIAEDSSTAVIYGMPREACATGNVDWQLPLEEIPKKIVEITRS